MACRVGLIPQVTANGIRRLRRDDGVNQSPSEYRSGLLAGVRHPQATQIANAC